MGMVKITERIRKILLEQPGVSAVSGGLQLSQELQGSTLYQRMRTLLNQALLTDKGNEHHTSPKTF